MKEFKKLKKFKVLVCVPHYDGKNYCFDDFLSRVTNLTYKNYDILIADNSKNRKNKKKIMKSGVQSIYVNPKQKDNRQYIADTHEALRVAALIGNYDFMLHLESDVFPPLDIIERLLSHQKMVVAAPYFINFGHDSHLMVQHIEGEGDLVRHTVNVGGGYDILLMDGKLKKVHHAGLGCILIHKSVLQKINFRWMKGLDSHPDAVFAADCNAQQIPIFLDTSISNVEHRNSSWSEVTDSFDLHLSQ